MTDVRAAGFMRGGMPRTSSIAAKRPKPTTHVPAEAPAVSDASSAEMTFDEAIRYLYDRVDIERMRASRVVADLFKLDRMRLLLAKLGSPHESIRSIHVAGTKGKGSTCEMTAAGLEACGYTVGIYTSPHLIDIRERIRINRRLISREDFARVASTVRAAAAELPSSSGEPTFFELTTAMCFVHFAEQAVDVAVIECGLGGRLDSTNVIVPLVCAVTSISLDHTQILGDTVEKIAAEKAGIFKPGIPAVTLTHAPEVAAVFRDAASALGSPLTVIGQDIEFSTRFDAGGAGRSRSSGADRSAGPRTRVSFFGRRTSYEHIAVPLLGEYQADNCGLALGILDALAERGMRIDDAAVARGFEGLKFPGRLQTVSMQPRVIADGAHNPESVRCLMRAIGSHIGYDSLVVIFGCAADKDTGGMLAQISSGADKVVFTRATDNARAADPKDLHRAFVEMSGKMSQYADSFPEALRLASRAVGRGDLICVTGSFYLVGEALKHFGITPGE